MTRSGLHRTRSLQSNHPPRRKGMALLVVVVLVMLISLGAYRFSFYMESQYRLTRLHEERVQARLAALSGMELAAAIVEMPVAKRAVLGGLQNNASIFQHVAMEPLLETAPSLTEESVWRFSLISPRMNDDSKQSARASTELPGVQSLSMRFGLENESAKLHIPTLLAWDRMKPGHARLTLLGLPGMNEARVDTWLTELGISKPIDRGGNTEQRSSLDDIKQIWFGGDLNQNYQLDPLEIRFESQRSGQNRAAKVQPSDQTSSTNAFRPLQRYLTWYSGHRNVRSDGQPRVNLNESDLRSLHRTLSMIWPQDWANFVIAMRQLGPGSQLGPSSQLGPGSQLGPSSQTVALPSINLPGAAISTSPNGNTGTVGASTALSTSATIVQDWQPDFSKAAVYSFRSPLDLVGAVVELPATVGVSGPKNSATQVKRTIRNPFSSDLASVRNYLQRLLDDVTVNGLLVAEGRIDVSEASVEVLAGVPGLDLALAQRIVQRRNASNSPASTAQTFDDVTWLLDTVDITKLKELEPYLTFRSDVYSVQAIGYRDNQSAVYRMTATIDACQSPAQLRNKKVWHPWDRGFSIEQLADSKP
jgi:Type II secretion system (T2SS), protein K